MAITCSPIGFNVVLTRPSGDFLGTWRAVAFRDEMHNCRVSLTGSSFSDFHRLHPTGMFGSISFRMPARRWLQRRCFSSHALPTLIVGCEWHSACSLSAHVSPHKAIDVHGAHRNA